MTDISIFANVWYLLIQKINNGEKIRKEDVLEALESEYPVPDEAKPILAQMLNGEGSYFIKGKKPKYTIGRKGLAEFAMAQLFVWRYEGLKNEFKNTDRLQGESPSELAKDTLASEMKLSRKQLERYLRESNKLIQEDEEEKQFYIEKFRHLEK